MMMTLVFGIAAFMLTPKSQAQAMPDAFTQRLLTATQEARDGDLPAAQADSKAAIALDPARADGWYELGSILGQTGDFPGAEAALRHAIQLQPGLAKAHFGLALTLIANPRNKQDWQGSVAECQEALKSQPDYPEALNLLGTGLLNTGQTDNAITTLRHALQLAPALPEAHFNLAMALESKGELDASASEYRSAIAAKGDYAEASSQFGKLLLRLGKPAEAESALNTALCLNPDLLDAHYTLARLLRASHQLEDAQVEFAEAKELGERPQNGIQSAELSNQALALAAKGDMKIAIASLRKAITLKPDYGVPHYNLGLLLADSGDLPGAVSELSKAISLTPGQATMWFDLGRVLRAAGDKDGALRAVAWAARLSPSDAAMQAELAALQPDAHANPVAPVKPTIGAQSDAAPDHVVFAARLTSEGDNEGAAGELLRALTLQPALVEARRALAHAYTLLDNQDSAVLEDYKIVHCAPTDAATHAALGKTLLTQGKITEAVKQLKLALVYDPKSAEARASLRTAEQLSK